MDVKSCDNKKKIISKNIVVLLEIRQHSKESLQEGEWGRGVLSIMHDRSRMAIDPRIPTMPGRSMSGLARRGGGCTRVKTKHENQERLSKQKKVDIDVCPQEHGAVFSLKKNGQILEKKKGFLRAYIEISNLPQAWDLTLSELQRRKVSLTAVQYRRLRHRPHEETSGGMLA